MDIYISMLLLKDQNEVKIIHIRTVSFLEYIILRTSYEKSSVLKWIYTFLQILECKHNEVIHSLKV